MHARLRKALLRRVREVKRRPVWLGAALAASVVLAVVLSVGQAGNPAAARIASEARTLRYGITTLSVSAQDGERTQEGEHTPHCERTPHTPEMIILYVVQYDADPGVLHIFIEQGDWSPYAVVEITDLGEGIHIAEAILEPPRDAPATPPPAPEPCGPTPVFRGEITDAGQYQLGDIAFTIPDGVNLRTAYNSSHQHYILQFYASDTDDVSNQITGEIVAMIAFTDEGDLASYLWNGKVYFEIGGESVRIYTPELPDGIEDHIKGDTNPGQREVILEGSTAGPTLEQMYAIIRSAWLVPRAD